MKKRKHKHKIRYNARTWLNGETSASTGSVACFAGNIQYGHTLYKHEMVLEVADCHNKIRLHRAGTETPLDFINKLQLLETEIRKFKQFLESHYCKPLTGVCAPPVP